MLYKQIDIIQPEEIGIEKDVYIGAPIILEQGLTSVLIPDSNNNLIHTVNLISKEHLDEIDLSKKDSVCLTGLACHEGYMFVTSDESEGYIINNEKDLVGSFRGNMWGYGGVKDVAVIDKQLWGVTDRWPGLVKLEPSDKILSSYRTVKRSPEEIVHVLSSVSVHR